MEVPDPRSVYRISKVKEVTYLSFSAWNGYKSCAYDKSTNKLKPTTQTATIKLNNTVSYC